MELFGELLGQLANQGGLTLVLQLEGFGLLPWSLLTGP